MGRKLAELDLIVMGDAQMDLSAGPVKPVELRGPIQVQMPGEETEASEVQLLAGRVAGRRLTIAPKLGKSPGGSADNVAFAAAKLGAKVGIICSLGDDENGGLILEKLKEISVDTSQVRVNPGVQTGVSILIKTEEGGRASVHFSGANALLSEHDLDIDYLKRAKAFCLTNFYLLPGVNGRSLRKIFQKAKNQDLITFLDPGPIPFTSDKEEIGSVLEALEFTDFFLPTKDEVCLISDKESPGEAAQLLIRYGAEKVVVKLGSRGCLVVEGGKQVLEIGGFSLESVVDTTGAGDVFAAALITRLLEGKDIVQAATFANVAAALSCTGEAREAFPTVDEVCKFIGGRKKHLISNSGGQIHD